ncbi:MAG: hypothetical protein Tsb0019_41900 [Roseibium sp.]
MIDDFSRECLATVVDTSISGIRVARELDRIAEMRGFPCMVVSDNGTELTSNAMLKWQEDRGVEWHSIAPGKRECPELCVSGPAHAVSDTQASKRSPNIMANWLRAANHSLTFLPSFSKLRIAR